MKHVLALASLAALATSRSAAGQAATAPASPAQSVPAAGPTYDFIVTPGVWVPRLGGAVKLGPDPAAGEINLEEGLNLDASEGLFNAEISMLKDRVFQLDLSGFDFSTDRNHTFTDLAQFGALTLNPGDQISGTFDMTSVAVEFAYWAFEPRCSGKMHNGHASRVDLRFAPAVGVRYVDVDQTLTVASEGREVTGGEWLCPFVGMQLHMCYHVPDSFPFVQRFRIDGAIGAGPALGGDGGAAAHIRVGMTAFFTDNLGLTFGYRLIHLSVENEEYELSGGLQGLFFAVNCEF